MGSEGLKGRKRRGRPVITTIIVLGTFLSALSLLFLPFDIAIVVVMAILFMCLLLDALFNRLIDTMALRNSSRRPVMTALVIGGLLIGTAVISSSFVINDTLDNMISTQAAEAFGEVDLTVASQRGGYEYFDEGLLDSIVSELRQVDSIRTAHSVILDTVAGQDLRTGIGEPALQTIGAEEQAYQDLGELQRYDGSPISGPLSGTIYLNQAAARNMGVTEGDSFLVLRGNRTATLTVGATVEPTGLAGFNRVPTAIMNLSDLMELVDRQGERNLLMIAVNGEINDARAAIDNILSESASGTGMTIVSDKQETIRSTREFMNMFVVLFFVLGSFSVIAGTALIVNIFSMLGEERKSELGVLRALGFRRDQLKRLLVYEGAVYAVLASAVGAILGVGMAYIVAWVMASVSTITGMQLLPYFDFRPSSLFISFAIGAFITMVTTYMVATRIARLNIVGAMRDLEASRPTRQQHNLHLIGAAILVSGGALTALGIRDQSLILANTGLSLIGLSIGLWGQRLIADRWAWTIGSIVMLLPWLPLPNNARLFPYAVPTEIFILAGLFMVTACLVLIMVNNDLLIAAVVKMFGGRGEYRAVIKTAMSYPLRARFRTALSIFIFGLVIFTVTTLSVVSSLVGTNVGLQITESSGGFDIIAQTGAGSPIVEDPWETMNSTSSYFKGDNATIVLSFPTALANLERYGGISSRSSADITQMVGIDRRFFEVGSYPLATWDEDNFSSERDVWDGVLNDPSLAIVDGSLGGGVDQTGVMASGDPLKVGDRIALVNAAGAVNVTVVGVMKQSVLNGVFMAEPEVRGVLEAQGFGLMLIRLVGGLDAVEQSALLERGFLPNGLQTVAVAELARESTRTIDGMFALGRGYLALGLIIGIIGLGIITMRNIRERRKEIGIMRAVGYRRGMVLAHFMMESGAISMLGILIGTTMGVLVGYQLWIVTLKDSGFSFYLDWWPILLIDVLALVTTLLSVYPAARGATHIAPADVLRFE
jgi:putative ABC transport system permease protein